VVTVAAELGRINSGSIRDAYEDAAALGARGERG
jgi:hypothetical protein